MSILEVKVWVTLSNNISYYESLGYEIPRYKDKDGKNCVKRGTKILVNVSDLPKRSNVKITKICDICEAKIQNQGYNTVLTRREKDGKDYCFKCGNKVSAKTRSLTLDEVNELLSINNLTPLFNEYTDTGNKLLCMNKDGYKVVPIIDNLKANKIPRPFSKSNPYTIENINHFLMINKMSYKLLSDRFHSAGKHKLKWECNNNHEFYMSWDVFKKGHRCPECNESNGEKEVRRILEENNVSYEVQYEFNELKGVGGYPLRFDFAILSENSKLKLLIEYDGIFHYEKQYEDDHFEDLIEHDSRKNDYCKENKIKLLRIPYWDFDRIEDILKEELNEKAKQD